MGRFHLFTILLLTDDSVTLAVTHSSDSALNMGGSKDPHWVYTLRGPITVFLRIMDNTFMCVCVYLSVYNGSEMCMGRTRLMHYLLPACLQTCTNTLCERRNHSRLPVHQSSEE